VAFLQTPESFAQMQSINPALAGKLGDRQLLAWTLLSRTYQQQKKFAEAGAVQQQMLEAFEKQGKAAQSVDALAELGKIYAAASDPKQTAELFTRCAQRADELNDVLAASDCRSRLGSMLRELFYF